MNLRPVSTYNTTVLPEKLVSKTTETTKTLAKNWNKPTWNWKSGSFAVGRTGEISINFLWDGGCFRGEIGIFRLNGLESLDTGSDVFIRESTNRILSNSEQGYIVISNASEGARFQRRLNYEVNFNQDNYRGVKKFFMRSGDQFAFVMLHGSSFVKLANNHNFSGEPHPVFSLMSANCNACFQTVQTVDLTGESGGSSSRLQGLKRKCNRHYNDVILQLGGAAGKIETWSSNAPASEHVENSGVTNQENDLVNDAINFHRVRILISPITSH